MADEAAPASGPDPITILILVAANGYATDIVPAGVLCRDPDLWSYLVRVPRGKNRLTLLHAAAARGDVERTRILCRMGAPVDAFSREFRTPLHCCVGFPGGTVNPSQTSVAMLLLDAGAAIDSKGDSASDTPLAFAITTGNAEMYRLLLSRGASVHPGREARGIPLLFNAVLLRDAQAIEALLSFGADVNALHHGRTALHELARFFVYRHSDDSQAVVYAGLLLDHGANVNAIYHSRTPASYAAEKGFPVLVEYLRSRGGL